MLSYDHYIASSKTTLLTTALIRSEKRHQQASPLAAIILVSWCLSSTKPTLPLLSSSGSRPGSWSRGWMWRRPFSSHGAGKSLGAGAGAATSQTGAAPPCSAPPQCQSRLLYPPLEPILRLWFAHRTMNDSRYLCFSHVLSLTIWDLFCLRPGICRYLTAAIR